MGRVLTGPYYDEVLLYTLNNAYDWWDDFSNSQTSQDWFCNILAALYGIVTLVALVQLIRIQLRVPEYGWTTQKVFHFLNVFVNGVRCLIFVFHHDVQQVKPEIIHQYPTNQWDHIGLWLIIWLKSIPALVILSKVFLAGVSLFAALCFLLYGGRLFLMLKRFPVESKGRLKKLHEVGYVTSVCFACFLVRCIMMCFNAFDEAANLDLMEHPVLNFIYYLLVEILPSSLVLIILRKLPSKQAIAPYQPIQ